MKKLRFLGRVSVMLILALVLFLGLSIPVARWSEGSVDSPGTLTNVVLRHANVLPLDSSYVDLDQAIFVKDGQITRICDDSLADTAGFQEVDVRGQYVLPGLVDMHAHVFDRSDMTNYLAYGVTQIRNMMGFPMHLRWKKQWARGDFPGSEMLTASPTLNAGEGTDPFHNTLEEDEDLEAVLSQYRDLGYDFFKIYDGLSEAQFSTIMELAKQWNMKVAGHPPGAVPRTTLLSSDLSTFEHIEEVYNTYLKRKPNDSLARVIAKEFASAGKPVCLTLSAYYHIYRASSHRREFLEQIPLDQINPFLVFIGNRMLSEYEDISDQRKKAIAAKYNYMGKLSRIFYEEGVPLVFGTDTGPNLTVPGFTVHQEIQLLQEAGLPNYAILRAATLDAMRLLETRPIIGIHEGARAELLIVNENPLERLATLQHPATIIHNGVYYDSVAIGQLRSLGRQKQGRYVTMGNLLHQIFNK